VCNDCQPSFLAAEQRARAMGWIDEPNGDGGPTSPVADENNP
jgi:hypothetical protein